MFCIFLSLTVLGSESQLFFLISAFGMTPEKIFYTQDDINIHLYFILVLYYLLSYIYAFSPSRTVLVNMAIISLQWLFKFPSITIRNSVSQCISPISSAQEPHVASVYHTEECRYKIFPSLEKVLGSTDRNLFCE